MTEEYEREEILKGEAHGGKESGTASEGGWPLSGRSPLMVD